MTLVVARGGGPRRSPERLRNSAPWLRAQILGLATELAIVEGQEPVR